MQLTVTLGGYGDKELSGTRVIRTFDDLDKLALEVGRAVKRWVRQVPLRKQGSRITFAVYAAWVERGGEKAEPESAGGRTVCRPRKGKRGHAGGTDPEGAPGA